MFVNAGGTALESVNNTSARTRLGLAIGNNVQAWDADLDALAALDATVGFLVKTAAATFNRNVLTGTAAEITVTNGNGVAGNATISLPTALTYTGKTVQGGTFNNITVTGGTFNNITVTNAVSITGAASMLSPITNSLSSDVALNNVSIYFDGPSLAQGTVGAWFASGTVTVIVVSGSTIETKLWDSATVISSSRFIVPTGGHASIALSGFINNPVGNIRISVKDTSGTTGNIKFNASGIAKDSTITAIRIA